MNSKDHLRERFAELWTDYLEGELGDEGLAELRQILASDDHLVSMAADAFQLHRMLGLIVEEKPLRQDAFVADTMKRLPANQDEFVGSVMSHVRRSPSEAQKSGETQKFRGAGNWLRTPTSGWVVAAALFLCVSVYFAWPSGRQPIVNDGSPSDQGRMTSDPGDRVDVRLASSARATFFGELSPPVGSLLTRQREYVLMDGLVEVMFPTGATAILEGPAVFRVTSSDSLALDAGRCSVHAPDGAEGFRVDTPDTQVVDRGTRFSVKVSENSATEVFVKEGAADVYERSDKGDASQDLGTRLTQGDAKRFGAAGAFPSEPIDFDARLYRGQLPDRVVSYETTEGSGGGAENLVSVAMQRGGRLIEIPVDDLIPANLVWFKSSTSPASLCGPAELPSQRTEMLRDASLVTGVINPGGSKEPLTVDPILKGEQGTPGMAIHFDRPVRNGPGADVVLFDLQTFINPIDGDPFHVSPLVFRDGLRSHTIRHYDLTMESPEAKLLTSFHVHFFAMPVKSVVELQSSETVPRIQSMRYRGLAVGIDLSDLGFAKGETVDGLFIQDAFDDQNFVDPVFVAGLPEVN